MSATTDFIAELVRAANEVAKLTGLEKQRLLVRAVATVREMRLQSGMRGRPNGSCCTSQGRSMGVRLIR